MSRLQLTSPLAWDDDDWCAGEAYSERVLPARGTTITPKPQQRSNHVKVHSQAGGGTLHDDNRRVIIVGLIVIIQEKDRTGLAALTACAA